MNARILALVGALALGACGGPSVLPEQKVPPLVWSAMIHAAEDGPILVEVAGAPPAPLVAGLMSGQVIGYPTTFTADPALAPRPNLRTVMVFGAAPSLSEHRACAGDIAFAVEPPGRVTLLAAFCDRGRALTALRGGADHVRGPDDPKFAALVRMATRGLFRPYAEGDGLGDPLDF